MNDFTNRYRQDSGNRNKSDQEWLWFLVATLDARAGSGQAAFAFIEQEALLEAGVKVAG